MQVEREERILERFRELQSGLAPCFERFSADPRQPYTAVVIPSQSFDPRELAKIDGVAHYEERSLFNLMLLRHPRLQVIYVTSKRINPLIVDYYLHQMRGVPGAHARRRLHLLDCDDASPRPLAQKILERPHLLRRIAGAIPDRSMAHMVVFTSSPLERELSVRLGIPLNACDPDLLPLGSKTGGRRVFREAGLQVAPGREELGDVQQVAEGIADTWVEAPDADRIVVKLDESFSGEGNAILDLAPLADHAPGGMAGTRTERVAAVREALPSLTFEAPGLTWEEYAAQIDNMGAVCEAWIRGSGKSSPSVQLRVNPLREVQALSTHDQVLGGPGGQVFLGATFPAAPAYRLEIQELALRAGRVLADKGVIGRLGIDFVAVPRAAGGHELYAIEINMRQGGTTHPFNTLKFITDGTYDAETGCFYTAQGRERCYFATDNLRSPRYRGLLPVDLLDAMVLAGMHFGSDETGVVLHLLGCLSEFGKLGCTSIARSVDEAKKLHERMVQILDETCS